MASPSVTCRALAHRGLSACLCCSENYCAYTLSTFNKLFNDISRDAAAHVHTPHSSRPDAINPSATPGRAMPGSGIIHTDPMGFTAQQPSPQHMQPAASFHPSPIAFGAASVAASVQQINGFHNQISDWPNFSQSARAEAHCASDPPCVLHGSDDCRLLMCWLCQWAICDYEADSSLMINPSPDQTPDALMRSANSFESAADPYAACAACNMPQPQRDRHIDCLARLS